MLFQVQGRCPALHVNGGIRNGSPYFLIKHFKIMSCKKNCETRCKASCPFWIAPIAPPRPRIKRKATIKEKKKTAIPTRKGIGSKKEG